MSFQLIDVESEMVVVSSMKALFMIDVEDMIVLDIG